MKKLVNKNNQVVAIACHSKKDGDFRVPVFDVRVDRAKAEAADKATRQSKFMRPTFSLAGYSYQRSYK